MDEITNNPEIGRVLRASTVGFVVGCRVAQLEMPAFGALVKAKRIESDEEVYGLIYNMHIDDDPLVRRLVLAENPRPEIINDQRRNRLIPIEISVLAIGYKRQGELKQALPPRPPLSLDPVQMVVATDEVTAFTDKLGYLRLLLGYAGTPMPVDQLLVAHILDIYQRRGEDKTWALAAIQESIELLRSNYEVLIPTLEALSTAMPAVGMDGLLVG